VIGEKTLVTSPVNTAARVSSQAFFNCSTSVNVTDSVTWDYDKQGPRFAVRIYTSRDGIKPGQQDRFDIERDDANGVHNLIIKNVQMDLAVRYFCGLGDDGIQAAADLTVLGMIIHAILAQ